jgi:hypothetical protein
LINTDPKIQKELDLSRQVAEDNLDILGNVNIIQIIHPPHDKKKWEEKYMVIQ